MSLAEYASFLRFVWSRDEVLSPATLAALVDAWRATRGQLR